MRKQNWYTCQKARDLRETLCNCAEKYGKRAAVKFIDQDNSIRTVNYYQLRDDVAALGTALWSLGLSGKHIGLIGENSYEWIISYLAVVNGLGVIVPIDKELTDDEIECILDRSDASAVICSKTFECTMRPFVDSLPQLELCIEMGECGGEELSIGSLLKKGRELLADKESAYIKAEIDRDAMSVIIFTSGTTGSSKAVMLSQKNIIAVIQGAQCAVKPEREVLSVLPMNHTYECSCNILAMMSAGVTICICSSLKYLPQNLSVFKPPLITLVPLILETLYKRMTAEIKKSGKQAQFDRAVAVSNALLKFHIDLRWLFFRRIRKSLGGRLRLVICGGAPLRSDLVARFREIGIQILNGYGITECAPLVAVNRNRDYFDSSVGIVLPCCSVKIENPDKNGEGEILVKGDNVMLGYYHDEIQTKLAFTDGWFRTGDLGKMSGYFLQITGRKKNTIILSNGKNVQPEEIEECLCSMIPYIKEILVYAAIPKEESKQDEHISAIVVPDMDYISNHGITDIRRALEQDIRSANRRLPSFKQVRTFQIQAYDFEKTSTKKIKRFKAMEEI